MGKNSSIYLKIYVTACTWLSFIYAYSGRVPTKSSIGQGIKNFPLQLAVAFKVSPASKQGLRETNWVKR